jgi:SEC-C motif-containing protein
MMEKCPCGSDLDYSMCCEPFIRKTAAPETAEALLRSRYSAYVKKEVDYVFETIHPEHRETESPKNIEKWAKKAEWHKLEIIECLAGGPGDDQGTVEFIADYREKDQRKKHHEVAEFKKLDGKWYFFDARAPQIQQVIRTSPKIGRNDPCPCGSGKKHKKCCGA